MATILLQNVGASTLTFTQKLQLAASGGTGSGPAGTVYDCTSYSTQVITSTITFTVPNNTFIFGNTPFTYAPTSGSMFVISAPGITLQGTARSTKDAIETTTTTFRMAGGLSQKYHIEYAVSNALATSKRGDCLTLKNLNFKGAQSVYTSNSGAPVYTTNGGGGILITEPNLNASGSNVNNIIIDNVLVDGAKQHGIMIYGAVASKITNTRVRSAAGHGFYIDGESTSVSFDTCYASGNYLAGFCLKDAAYSSLNNCASDSNGLGYWLRNTTSTSLVSCGAEANLTRSNIPNNLGVILKQYPTGDFVVNDIGADNVNHIKGTSFFVSGGGNLTFTSPLSKDPGGNPGAGVFVNKRTAHFGFYGGVDKVNITAPRISGTTTLKYKYRLEALDSSAPGNIMIDDYIITYDPTNPTESTDPNPAVAVADVLDQGSGNVFGNMYDSKSFDGRRAIVSNPEENYRINNLMAMGKFTLPTYTAHPANPDVGTIYFNTDTNKLYIYNNAWYDTCCLTTVVPDCIFPSGLSTYTGIGGQSAVLAGNDLYTTDYIASNYNTPYIRKINITDLTAPVTLLPIAPSFLGMGITTLSYSSGENAIYFSGGAWSINTQSYIAKFSLTTNQVETYVESNLTGFLANCNTFVVGSYLYVTRGTWNNQTVVQKRSLSDLSLISTSTTNYKFLGGFQGNSTVVNDRYILFSRPEGDCLTFIVYDTQADTFEPIIIPNATTAEKYLTFYQNGGYLFVASQQDGLISRFNTNATWDYMDQVSGSYIINPSGLYVNASQNTGDFIVTFLSTASLPGTNWSLVAYNFTQNSYIASSENVSGGVWNGSNFMIELNQTTFGFGSGGQFHTMCSPYV